MDVWEDRGRKMHPIPGGIITSEPKSEQGVGRIFFKNKGRRRNWNQKLSDTWDTYSKALHHYVWSSCLQSMQEDLNVRQSKWFFLKEQNSNTETVGNYHTNCDMKSSGFPHCLVWILWHHKPSVPVIKLKSPQKTFFFTSLSGRCLYVMYIYCETW